MKKKTKRDPGWTDGRSDRARWYELEGQSKAEAVLRLADQLYSDQSSRRTRYKTNVQLFEKLALANYGADAYYRTDVGGIFADQDPRGLIRSAVQTARAEIYSKQKPKGQFQTSGATWKTRRKAQKLDKLHEGVLNQRQPGHINAWSVMQDAGTEAAIQGTGCVRVDLDMDAKAFVHYLVPVCELYHDPAEGLTPRTLIQQSPIDSDEAIRKYCRRTDDPGGNIRRRMAIESAPVFERADGQRTPRITRQVREITIWRLPDGPDLPGHTCTVIGDEIMAEGYANDGKWAAPAFPIVKVSWEKHRGSPWGQGIPQEGERNAYNANDLHERLLSRAKLAAGKRTFVWAGSCDVEQLKGNDEDTIVVIDQSAKGLPTETTVPPFGPAEVQFAEMEARNFWDSLGVSQVSAAARREPGVDSGAAQRTLNDTKAGRQLDKAQNFENSHVDLAYQHVYRARDLYALDPEAVLTWPGGRVLREVAIADVLVDDKDFSVTIAPAANLPNDPAGRQALVGELYASQIISQETYKQLLNWPDLEKELNVSGTETEYIDSLIDKYLDADEGDWDAGDYESPEGFLLDKNSALLRISAAYFQAKIDKAPAFNTDLLRRYAQELDMLIARAAEAKAAAMAPPAPAPGMMPGPAGAGLPGSPMPPGMPPG